MKNNNVSCFFQLKSRVVNDLKINNEAVQVDSLLDLTSVVLDYLYTLPASNKRLHAVETIMEETDPRLWSDGYKQYVKPLL